MLNNAFGLVAGVAGYRSIQSLPDVILKDANDVYSTLVDPDTCGYSPDRVRRLLDEEVSLERLRSEFAYLGEHCSEESTVFIYFSGHGGRLADGGFRGEYLLPYDVDPTSSTSIARSALSGAELSDVLRGITAQKLIVFLDCCHAGGLGTPKSSSLRLGLSEQLYEQLQQGRGRAVVASSRSTEFSYIEPDDTNSLFTKHLLGGLRGGAAGTDGLIRVFQLFEYLQPRVTAANNRQHPVLQVALEDNFPIASRRGGEDGSSSIDAEYSYDAFISFANSERDLGYAWSVLVPRLRDAGLRVAIAGDVEEPGVFRVVGDERAIRQSKRTVILLSPDYLRDRWATFRDMLSQTMDVNEGTFRLLPVIVGRVDRMDLPDRIRMLTEVDLGSDGTSERGIERLVMALRRPLPRWHR